MIFRNKLKFNLDEKLTLKKILKFFGSNEYPFDFNYILKATTDEERLEKWGCKFVADNIKIEEINNQIFITFDTFDNIPYNLIMFIVEDEKTKKIKEVFKDSSFEYHYSSYDGEVCGKVFQKEDILETFTYDSDNVNDFEKKRFAYNVILYKKTDYENYFDYPIDIYNYFDDSISIESLASEVYFEIIKEVKKDGFYTDFFEENNIITKVIEKLFEKIKTVNNKEAEEISMEVSSLILQNQDISLLEDEDREYLTIVEKNRYKDYDDFYEKELKKYF